MQIFTTIYSNWFEFVMIGVALMMARGTIIPAFLLIQSAFYALFEWQFGGAMNHAEKMFNASVDLYHSGVISLSDAAHSRVVYMSAQNDYYVVGGLFFMCMAFTLAYVKPLQSKTAFAYCIALCVQAILSIAMFFNGLEVVDESGKELFAMPNIQLIESIHSLVNDKMVIITVVIAWISVVLSRTVNQQRW